jgi:AraC family transcriptional regulator, transcriptional activator of pobA
MQYILSDHSSNGVLRMSLANPSFQRRFFQERKDKLLAILWNKGNMQSIVIDEVAYDFPPNHFLCLMVNQSFRLENAEDMVIWQFNRDFYCIVDHDKEVSCVGFLFYGSRDIFFIELQNEEDKKIEMLLNVFIDEFQTKDNIQAEMLRMLLKRLIIKLTRLARTQQLQDKVKEPDLDIVRQFNLLVENNYRKLHQVQDYANLMHKSPKTLSNLFKIYHSKSPSQVIQERIALEIRRLLIYTDKNLSEIAYELGFEELTHFSRFFKKMMGLSPSEFRESLKSSFSKSIEYSGE